MRGWVYVMSNKAMPGLVKVGYSMKDPDARAQELNHTGSPHPYVVDYEVFVPEPFEIEQKAHRSLSAKNEGKEWFKCSTEDAIAAIKEVSLGVVIHENYRQIDRLQAERQIKTKMDADAAAKRQNERKRLATDRVEKMVQDLTGQHRARIDAMLTPRSFIFSWLAGAFWASIVVLLFFNDSKPALQLLLIALGGAVIGVFIQSENNDGKKKSPEYLQAIALMNSEIESIRNPWAKCDKCGMHSRFDAVELAISDKTSKWTCGSCGGPISPPSRIEIPL